jgi:hypothetical protein
MNEVKHAQAIAEIGIDGECPICDKNPPFNVKTLAAIAEGEAMWRGEIPTKWYHSLEEAREDLKI